MIPRLGLGFCSLKSSVLQPYRALSLIHSLTRNSKARTATFDSLPLVGSSIYEKPAAQIERKGRLNGHACRRESTSNRLPRFDGNGGPEPMYEKVNSGYKIFHSKDKFEFFYGGEIPELVLAYETWGELNAKKDNTLLLFTGLSPSSHAKSHEHNSHPGWWEAFIGPGCALNTDEFFVVCVNVIGGCYGSSGPSSINPLTGKVRKGLFVYCAKRLCTSCTFNLNILCCLLSYLMTNCFGKEKLMASAQRFPEQSALLDVLKHLLRKSRCN